MLWELQGRAQQKGGATCQARPLLSAAGGSGVRVRGCRCGWKVRMCLEKSGFELSGEKSGFKKKEKEGTAVCENGAQQVLRGARRGPAQCPEAARCQTTAEGESEVIRAIWCQGCILHHSPR